MALENIPWASPGSAPAVDAQSNILHGSWFHPWEVLSFPSSPLTTYTYLGELVLLGGWEALLTCFLAIETRGYECNLPEVGVERAEHILYKNTMYHIWFTGVETFHGKQFHWLGAILGFPLEHVFQVLSFWLFSELTTCLRKKLFGLINLPSSTPT